MNIQLTLSVLACVYLRAAAVITGHATCDNEMYFYADGVQMAYSNDWTMASSISISDNTEVVGVKCVDRGVIAGIKVALDNGVKTDSTWKCSAVYEDGWNESGFDDCHWTSAVEYTDAQWRSKPAVLEGKAEWIWTDSNTGGDSTVYCRTVIKKPDYGCCEQLTSSINRLHIKLNRLSWMPNRKRCRRRNHKHYAH